VLDSRYLELRFRVFVFQIEKLENEWNFDCLFGKVTAAATQSSAKWPKNRLI
jgi:hypothetical protein